MENNKQNVMQATTILSQYAELIWDEDKNQTFIQSYLQYGAFQGKCIKWNNYNLFDEQGEILMKKFYLWKGLNIAFCST